MNFVPTQCRISWRKLARCQLDLPAFSTEHWLVSARQTHRDSETFFHPYYIVLKGNLGIFKNKGTPFWNFVPNSRHRKFCFGITAIETFYRLSATMMDSQSVVNLTVVGQRSWQYLRAPTLNRCTLSEVIRHTLSAAWYRCMGQLVTVVCPIHTFSEAVSPKQHDIDI